MTGVLRTNDETATSPARPAPLWTAHDVSALLRVPKARVYAMERAEILPSIRVGYQVRFSPEAIRAWLANGGDSRVVPVQRKAGDEAGA